MEIKFIKDWPCSMGPSFNKEKKYRFYPKGFVGDLSNSNAKTALENGFAQPAEKKSVKAGSAIVETAAKKDKSEKR